MWRVTAAFGYGTSGYSTEDYDERLQDLPVDEIQPEHIGSASKRLAEHGKQCALLPWAQYALDILSGAQALSLTAPSVKARSTPCMWRPQLEAYVRMRAAAVTSPTVLVGVSLARYFARPKRKGDRVVARSILNCRAFSSMCPTPPPLMLPSPADIIQAAAALSAKGPLQFLEADVRHCFHRWALPVKLRPFFGIHLRGHPDMWIQWYLLPMGWSWSPYLVQATAWATVLHVGAQPNMGLGHAVDKMASATGPPRMLDLVLDGKVCGFITIVYDNYLIFTNNGPLLARWGTALPKRLAHVGMTCKEVNVFGPSTLRTAIRPDAAHACSMVVQYGVGRDSVLIWRADPAKVERWPQPDSPLDTPREVARAVGTLVWSHTLSLKPIRRMAKAIDGLREAARVVNNTPTRWDLRTTEWSPAVIKAIRELLQEAHANAWCRKTPVTATTPRLVASDARGHGNHGGATYGWADLDTQQPIAVARGFPKELDGPNRIFIQEFFASYWRAPWYIRPWIPRAVAALRDAARSSDVRALRGLDVACF